MTTTMVLETDGVGARLSCPDRSCGELVLVIPHLEADLDLDPKSWNGIDSIELRVRDSDIEVELSHIGVVLIGVPPRAAEKLQFPTKINHSAAIDVQGAVQSPLNETLLRSQLAELAQSPSAPRAWSVSGMNSHRNPLHEQRAASIVREVTAKPAIEGRFWSDSLNAVQRARMAGQTAAYAVRLAALAAVSDRISAKLGAPLTIRTAPPESAAIAALLHCPLSSSLRQLFEGVQHEGPSLQARVTRSEKGYSCHCTDGCFEFESITQARSFAAQHLREQMVKQLGASEAAVTITQEDRYSQVRGKRGPVRVFLESIITASCKR